MIPFPASSNLEKGLIHWIIQLSHLIIVINYVYAQLPTSIFITLLACPQ